MQEKKVENRIHFNIVTKIVIVIFVLAALGSLMYSMMKYNELQSKKNELQTQVDEYRMRIEELENEIAAPFNEEYVIKIARKKLNLSLPYSVIFYNDLNE